jgi:predicted 2-oxoglutarate/Fe(II)-dependent dioxygenase YbiX
MSMSEISDRAAWGRLVSIEFASPNIGLARNFLSLVECEEIVQGITAAAWEPGHVVRAGRAILDPSVRSCREHGLPQPLSERLGKRLVGFLCGQSDEIDDEIDSFDGPYFLSYGPGSFFRSHRDVGSADDPVSMTTRRWSLVVYLNGPEPAGVLPPFDGGALILYDRALGATDRRVVIIPRPGLLALFRSSLLHEVMRVREGTRYAVVGWFRTSHLHPSGGRK